MVETRTLVLAAAAGGAAALALAARAARRAAAAAGPAPTDFEPFLKRHVDNPSAANAAGRAAGRAAARVERVFDPAAPTSFEAYLKRDAPAGPATPDGEDAAADSASDAASTIDPAARPVAVLFGTEFGFSREVAERLAAALIASSSSSSSAAPIHPELLDMADFPSGLPALARAQALLVACSTQGDGVPPGEARAFVDWLRSPAAPALDGVPFSVCALGDTSYAHFAACGKALDARLGELGGARLAPRVDVNREDYGAVDGWIAAAVAGVGALALAPAADLAGGGLLAAGEGGGGEGEAKRFSKARPFYAAAVAVEGLCNIASAGDKDTVRVELDLGDSGLTYLPGDALGIWPTNAPALVAELLAELPEGSAGLLVCRPAWHYADAALEAGATSVALPEALARCYDLRAPRPELLAALRDALQAALAAEGPVAAKGPAATNGNGHAANGNGHAASNGNGHAASNGNGKAANGKAANGTACAEHGCLSDKLAALAALAAAAAAAEAYLAPRHVADVLRDWRPAALGPAELLACLRQLAPRLYSISSSPLEDPRRVQATVAAVRYASLGAARAGVCSTQLGERLPLGSTLPVYVHANPDFRLPADAATPIVMVGPGTGLAPFRAFLQQRILGAAAAGAAAPRPGRATLFFGCRRRDQDFLYGPLLEAWAAEGAVELVTAFSREDPSGKKVYVQDRLRERGDAVWADLYDRRGHFYVCGDAAGMAPAVEGALLDVAAARLPGGAPAARAWLDQMAAEGRYQRDVWFS
jgi:sulfite reductase (NADPH) flavoprotein alpha-component